MASSSGFVTLYMAGPLTLNSAVPTYVFGVTGSSNKGLNTYTRGLASGDAGFNLYMHVVEPSYASGTLDLYLNASTFGTTGLYGFTPLYISGDPLRTSMNLTITGHSLPTRYETPYGLNLYLENFVGKASKGINLNMMASNTGNTLGYVYKGANLYIRGQGLIAGATPYNAAMNLYLHCPGLETALTLFMNADGPTTKNLDLFTRGIGGYSNKALDLVMPRHGGISNGLNTFIRGWDSGSTPADGTYSSMIFDELDDMTFDYLDTLEM